MLEVKIFDLGYCKNEELTRVVCVSKYKDKYVFSYNKKRNGWEIPGGHIEESETREDVARRKIYEETCATNINVETICVYKISTFGLLCYCEILELEELPKESEIKKIMFSDSLPDNLTFSESFKRYFETVKNKKGLE